MPARQEFSDSSTSSPVRVRIRIRTRGTYLPGRGRGRRVGELLRLADLVLLPPGLTGDLRALREAAPTAAVTPLDDMGPRVASRRRAQALAQVLGRRAERPTCGRRQEEVSTVTVARVLVIAHRREVAKLPAASHRSARADHRLADADANADTDAARRTETRSQLVVAVRGGPAAGGAQDRPYFP